MKTLFMSVALLVVTHGVLAAEDAVPGARVYTRFCGSCHDRGDDHPGTANLGYKRGAGKGALLDRGDDLPATHVRSIVRLGAGSMPAFRAGEINDHDLNALAEYLASGPHK